MVLQASNGINRHLNKTSAKSAIKSVVRQTPAAQQQGKELSAGEGDPLTGSRNVLKGVVQFLGALLITTGINAAVTLMNSGLSLPCSSFLSGRDAWFVMALPVFHKTLLDCHAWEAAGTLGLLNDPLLAASLRASQVHSSQVMNDHHR
jgi:hypothetical protein